MAKILEINPSFVSIGMDNGSITEIPSSSLNFVPHIGDEVEIFQTTEKTIISKKTGNLVDLAGGININVNNTNNAATANTQQAGQGGYAPVYVGSGKPVNKLVYCILCFFLGGIGAHKFYAGKTLAGVFYFLFCFTYIPGLLALIEFVVALTKRSDSLGNIYV